MKKRLSRLFAGVAAVVVVGSVGGFLGVNHAVAQVGKPAQGSNPLSPYIGQCVEVFVVNGGIVAGLLQATAETHVELEVQGYPLVLFMPHLSAAAADPENNSGACNFGQNTNITERLEGLGRRAQ